MSKKRELPFELEAAHAREDFGELREEVAAWQRDFGEDRSQRPLSDWLDNAYDFEALYRSGQEDADKALACVIIALHDHADPAFLFFLAAGPLEDLLRNPSPEILGRVITEARRTARFRWMLTGIWMDGLHPNVAEQLRVAIAGLNENDPMPPI